MGFSINSRVDPTDGTVIYYGEANIGAGTDEPRWKIKRLRKDNTEWLLEWASGDTPNDKIWDNRTSLEYS